MTNFFITSIIVTSNGVDTFDILKLRKTNNLIRVLNGETDSKVAINTDLSLEKQILFHTGKSIKSCIEQLKETSFGLLLITPTFQLTCDVTPTNEPSEEESVSIEQAAKDLIYVMSLAKQDVVPDGITITSTSEGMRFETRVQYLKSQYRPGEELRKEMLEGTESMSNAVEFFRNICSENNWSIQEDVISTNKGTIFLQSFLLD